MDPAKVKAVQDWLVPFSCKKLQYFLGFPDPSRQFEVEVDTPDSETVTIFSQWSAERNYDIEMLLVVKLAPEEWRHWFDGMEQPFVV